MEQGGSADFPDGIGEQNIRLPGSLNGIISWLPLLVLGALLLVALSGVLGGTKNRTVLTSSPQAALTFNAPAVLRSGQLFEMRIKVKARRPISKPVLAIPVAYWHDLTINTLYPGPTSEKSEDGFFLLEFEPLKAGNTMDVKIDGQVNPPLITKVKGQLELRDDTRPIAAMPISLKVLP